MKPGDTVVIKTQPKNQDIWLVGRKGFVEGISDSYATFIELLFDHRGRAIQWTVPLRCLEVISETTLTGLRNAYWQRCAENVREYEDCQRRSRNGNNSHEN